MSRPTGFKEGDRTIGAQVRLNLNWGPRFLQKPSIRAADVHCHLAFVEGR